MELAVRSAAISLLILMAHPSAFAGNQHRLSIRVFDVLPDSPPIRR